MMFKNVAKVGDKIRAYDFAQFGINSCYIEGTVLDKGNVDNKYYACYKIQLTKKIVKGKNVTKNTEDKIWYVPFETTDDAFDKKVYPKGITRVMKIDEPEEGKTYALTGTKDDKCIANGNTWSESEVKKDSFDTIDHLEKRMLLNKQMEDN